LNAKSAVLSSLSCPDAQRGYRHAIDEFVDWYCSEPRLSFNKTVVIRYRMHLESRLLAPATINLRQREGHWAIVNLSGKGGHVRTVPVPDWVYRELSTWTEAAGIHSERVFRRVSSASKPWGDGVTEKLAWHVVKEFGTKTGVANLAPHELRRYAACGIIAAPAHGFATLLATN